MSIFQHIDYRYIVGRDNYSCVYCHKEFLLKDVCILKISSDQEWSPMNAVVSCPEHISCGNRGNHSLWTNFPSVSLPGRLIAVMGPMFCEKTTTTRSLINKYSKTIGKYIWVKPDVDVRGRGITTHNHEEISAEIISADRPDKSLNKLKEYDIVAFDEVQFYSERILYVVHQLLKVGKLVIVNGLKLDARRNIFGVIHYLLAEADDIISPKSICNICKKIDVATRTKKKTEGGPSVEVGGADKYYTVCPDCDKDSLDHDLLM